MALNVTTAVFGPGCNTATASPSLAQWDTEQVLQISGIDLPDSYKVEFSTVYTRNAIPEIGDASGVDIPNELLQRSAPITANVVLYGENGGRNREYWITIYITPGQPPETITPDPEQADVIDQAIAALNNGVARTEAAATSAEGSARDAEAAAEAVQNLSVEAETLATGEPATVEKAVDPETGAVTLNFGLPRGAKGDPLTYEDLTEEQKAELVQGPILEAQGAAVTAVGNARASAVDAVGAAGTTQVNAVNQAGTTQVGNVNQAGTTQVQAVADKGAEVIGSIPPDYTDLTAEVDDLSRHLNDKQDAPATAGTAGQVLSLDDQLHPVWADQSGGEDAAHNYAFDGVDLSTVFADADALQAALAAENYSNIHIGDYWPVTLNGTFRDYGQATIPTGTTYYSDAACETEAGTTEEEYTGAPSNDTNYPGGWKTCSFKIGSTTYYVLATDCLPYLERTLTNALMKFEVCGINQYWRYGDNGANNFHNGKPHLVLWSRDGLPTTLKMRKANEIWEGTVIDTFTGDGTTSVFTLSGTVGTIGYVFVDGVRKAYNTDYTYGSNKITFKAGKIPAADAVIKVEWMEAKTPWTGSALYKTFNDPDYGILKLIQTADVKLYNHIYKGNNNQGMRYYAETRSKTNQQSGVWEDRGILFLPTDDEIWGRWIATSGANYSANMTQWPIFVGGRRHFAKGAGDAASRYSVWCASSHAVTSFANVYSNGAPNANYASYAYVAAPGFLLS